MIFNRSSLSKIFISFLHSSYIIFVLSKSEISIPYRQIQYINHTQSFNDKMLGVMNVTIETAGDDDVGNIEKNEGVLPILEKNIALAIENELLKRSNVNNIAKP